jgi:hypothetical protein
MQMWVLKSITHQRKINNFRNCYYTEEIKRKTPETVDVILLTQKAVVTDPLTDFWPMDTSHSSYSQTCMLLCQLDNGELKQQTTTGNTITTEHSVRLKTEPE